MVENKLNNQIKTVNSAFHMLWFNFFMVRPTFSSEDYENLSFIDLRVIGIAYDKHDLILKEIRDIVKVQQTTLSSIVARLEKNGFVDRVINRRDMRSFSLRITKKGKEIVEEHRRIDIEQAKMIVTSLEGGERDDFVKLLNKVAVKLRQKKEC